MACALVALSASACGDGTRPPDAEPTIAMLDPHKKHYEEKGYPEWAVAYMKWQFETAASILWDIKDCTAGQDATSPVVFLERGARHEHGPSPFCAFDSEKAILFPLLPLGSPITYYTDSSMPLPSADVSVLTRRVNESIDDFIIDEASIRVDGRELRQPLGGKMTSADLSIRRTLATICSTGITASLPFRRWSTPLSSADTGCCCRPSRGDPTRFPSCSKARSADRSFAINSPFTWMLE